MNTKVLPYGAPDHPSVRPVNLKKLKPYGDAMEDGRVQLSFTLPVPVSPEAGECAKQLMEKMGLIDVKIATMLEPSEGFSFFVAYGECKHSIDFTKITVLKVEAEFKEFDELNKIIEEKIGRKIIVLGATTGYDAHTVGIDAIFNMKGYHGDWGLERYPWIDARNLGAQVLNEELLKLAAEHNADALLVSQIVTEKDCHIANLKELTRQAEKKNVRKDLILIAGGPRISHPIAIECGMDAGFGPGSLPSHVVSFLVDEILRREGKSE